MTKEYSLLARLAAPHYNPRRNTFSLKIRCADDKERAWICSHILDWGFPKPAVIFTGEACYLQTVGADHDVFEKAKELLPYLPSSRKAATWKRELDAYASRNPR
jgi:hypothetical protein